MSEALPLSEKIAAESAPAKTVKPEGSPALWPFIQLPRRKRAQFFDALKSLPANDDGELVVSAGGGLEQAAQAMSMIADVEDALRMVATDEKAYNTWVYKAKDEDLMALMGWYFERFNPGEAAASPN